MANIASSNVTVTILQRRTLQNSRTHNLVQLQFGNGTLTYPVGGIPLPGGNMGCPTTIEQLIPVDTGSSTYEVSFSSANQSIKLYGGVAHAHDLLSINGATTNTTALGAGPSLVTNSATNVTVAGVNSATNGGVQSFTPTGAQAELGNIAIASQTVICEVIGW